MAFSDENSGMVMPVAPMYGGGGMGGFGGGFGNDGWWIILLLLCLGNGWGGNNGGFGGGFGGGSGAGALYPWLNNSNQLNDGFQNQLMNDNITSIRDGVQGLSTQLCGCCGDTQMALATGFAGVNASINGAQNAIAAQMYTNQISDLERSFAAQTANTQGLMNLQSQLAQCCCDNRLATCQTQNIVQNESSATRFADANNTRDIIDSQNKNSQMILDKLCALELDGYKRENDNLRSQLNMATLRESQTAQNAFIAQGFSNEVDQLYNRLNSCPVPTTPVYGRTPIFTCNGQTTGCGCGCGA